MSYCIGKPPSSAVPKASQPKVQGLPARATVKPEAGSEALNEKSEAARPAGSELPKTTTGKEKVSGING